MESPLLRVDLSHLRNSPRIVCNRCSSPPCSFLFNVGLVLLCTLPVVQFCTQAFSGYARLTDAESIFGGQFRYLPGFRELWRYNVFVFTLLGFTLLSAIYFAAFPSDRRHLARVMADIKVAAAIRREAVQKKITQAGGSLQGVVVVKPPSGLGMVKTALGMRGATATVI